MIIPSLGLLLVTQGLIVDVSAGLPVLASDEIRLNGDLGLGYETQNWGLVANGSLSYFDVESELGIIENVSAGGGLDAWYVTGAAADLFRFEVRTAFSGGLLDSQDINATTLFADQSSIVGRGNLLLGGRFQWPRVRLDFLAGGGGQVESINALTVDQTMTANGSTTNVSIEDTEKFTIQYEGRIQSRIQLVSEILSLRLKLDVKQYEVTRDNQLLSIGLGQMPTQASELQATTYLELRSRLFIDADILSFEGFVPALFVGLDVIEISSELGTTQSNIPVFGIDLGID